jgi:dihydrofolate reductase
MPHIVADISMSLDGFVTGPNPGLEAGLGQMGEGLHTWAFSDNEIDQATLRESTEATGAVVMGRRLFDIIDGPHGWSDEVGYGAKLNGEPPVFVVTHQPPARVRLKRPITFITTGLGAAVQAAQQAAGQRDVVILGGGTPLFKPGQPIALIPTAVRQSPNASHLTYRLQRG